MAAPCLFILPERFAATSDAADITDATGSGPFRFIRREWIPGHRAVWERDRSYTPNYRGGLARNTAGAKIAHFDRVEWKIDLIADVAAAAAAMHTGEVDWWEQVPVDLAAVLRRNRELIVDVIDPLGFIGCFRPNHTTFPFDKPEVRRAVAVGLSQSVAMQAVVGNNPRLYRDGVGYFVPASPFALSIGSDAFMGDVEKARRDIDAAGAAGAKIRLLHATDIPSIHGMSTYCTELFRKIGLEVEPYADTWVKSVWQQRTSRDPLERGGWSGFVTASPGANHLSPSTNILLRADGPDAWFGWPDIPALEALREDWFGATSQEAANTIALSIHRVALDAIPYVPMGQYLQPAAYRRDLAGILKGPTLFWNVMRH